VNACVIVIVALVVNGLDYGNGANVVSYVACRYAVYGLVISTANIAQNWQIGRQLLEPIDQFSDSHPSPPVD
jgi:hypothetical protein